MPEQSAPRLEIVCPTVLRQADGKPEILLFRHPLAGVQIVKAMLEDGDNPKEVSARELKQDAGLVPSGQLIDLGKSKGIEQNEAWHFFACPVASAPDQWVQIASQDDNREYAFFWQKMDEFIDQDDWDPAIIRCIRFVQGKLERMDDANRARLLPKAQPELAQSILDMAAERGADKSFCPSEVARHLAGSDEKTWRALMKPIRAEAVRLAKSGEVVITRKGKPVDPDDFKGIYRIIKPTSE